jgi:hypothetical protein
MISVSGTQGKERERRLSQWITSPKLRCADPGRWNEGFSRFEDVGDCEVKDALIG